MLLLVAAGPAVAQDTRAEWLEQQRAERAQALAAYRPNIAERTLLYVEDKRILEQLSAGWHGLYPRVGGFTTGSGFAMGAGYRRAVPGTTQMEVDASAAFSTRGYKGVDLRLRAPALLDGLLHLDSTARWWDYTQEDFFGIGDSSRVNRSSYRYEALAFNVSASLRPRRWLTAGVDLGHLRPTIRTGTDPRFPSIEQRFTDGEAPGLARQARLLTARSFVDFDYRDERLPRVQPPPHRHQPAAHPADLRQEAGLRRPGGGRPCRSGHGRRPRPLLPGAHPRRVDNAAELP
jgi:hypothetical protein